MSPKQDREETAAEESQLKTLLRTPWGIVLLMLGLGGSGTGILSNIRGESITKTDFHRLETKVDRIGETVDELKIESEGRRWAETHKVSRVP